MTGSVKLGFTLQPDPTFLDLLSDLIEAIPDYYEVAPETLWFEAEGGGLHPNGFYRTFRDLQRRTGRPMVAHGVGLSLGGASVEDAPRLARWLDAIAATHDELRFQWYTDHHGLSAPLGHCLAQPLPLPPTLDATAAVTRRLQALRQIVPEVGVENTVTGFTFGEPLDEADHLRRTLDRAGGHLLLDLHNVYTMALNLGFEPMAWIDRLDLSQVIEIHISGGAETPPGWLPSGRTARLDAHSGPVPEPVWAMLAEVLPRCPHLRGVTLERMEGTVGPEDVPLLHEEMTRARALITRHGAPTTPRSPAPTAPIEPPDLQRWRGLEAAMVDSMCARRPVEALTEALTEALPASLPPPPDTEAQRDGQRVASLLVAHLRFGRLLRGGAQLESWFDADPEGFTEVFRRYHLTHPPTAHFPTSEARDFHEALLRGDITQTTSE